MLLVVPDFIQVYDSGADQIFASKDPVECHDDFNCQFAKIIHGLHSATEYSKADSNLNGIRPIQLRRVVGRGHYEFSTSKQQDVEQYIRHLFEIIDNNAPTGQNPVNAVRFVNVNRFEDIASTHVRYRKHDDYILPLTIPMAYARQSKDDPERKTISLKECISATFADEAMKMGSFPDYLLLQFKRFAYTATGEQEKLKVDVEEVDELDLTAYYSEGLQPGEQALPDDDQPKKTEVDENIVAQITAMDMVDLNAARRAVRITKNAGAEAAMNYLLDHFDDVPMEDEPAAQTTGPTNVQVRNGSGKYRLDGFISHIGSSPSSGHYVVHLKKNGTWYIYNDEKVAVSQNLPKSLGYVYLYKRV
uniref:USP domain-containing protein n=1 Tax=Ditylenchus dipsaci TaxID=166011 RepID=A0A915EQV9_9BILA